MCVGEKWYTVITGVFSSSAVSTGSQPKQQVGDVQRPGPAPHLHAQQLQLHPQGAQEHRLAGAALVVEQRRGYLL